MILLEGMADWDPGSATSYRLLRLTDGLESLLNKIAAAVTTSMIYGLQKLHGVSRSALASSHRQASKWQFASDTGPLPMVADGVTRRF